MPYPYPHGKTVTVVRAALVTDPFSGEDEMYDWTAADETDFPKCAVAPRTSEEPLEGRRVQVMDGLSVYGPKNMDVTSRDRIRIDGVLYEVDGEPAHWESPFTGRGLTTVDVVRWEG